MPKQIKDKNKSTRMKYALDAIEHHGRCSHKEISIYVANKIDADPDLSSFKKAIHNDIKDLVKDHSIGIEYFTPAGEPILAGEEDDYKNKRTQYFILGGEGQIKGGSLLDKVGAYFRPQRLSSPLWKIVKMADKEIPKEEQINILLRINNKSFSIETNKDQLPFKIVIGRLDKYIPTQDEIEGAFGKRTSLLLLPWTLLSAPKANTKLGHFILAFNEDGGKIDMNIDFIKGKDEDDELFIKKQENIALRKVTFNTINNFIERAIYPGTDLVEKYFGNRASDETNIGVPGKLRAFPETDNFSPISIDIGNMLQVLISSFYPEKNVIKHKKAS